MAKERGVFKVMWKNFIASFKLQSSRKFIGEDYYGTKYYEEQPRSSNPNRPPRYFIPVNKNNFEQELPVEWESWLRYRRKDPPLQEEIESNYQLAINKNQNAAEISKKYSNELQTTGNPTESISSQATNPGYYPTYTEYQNFGKNYRPKDPYKEE